MQEAYERYKHLDALLSNVDRMGETFESYILHDLWEAVKAAAETEARVARLGDRGPYAAELNRPTTFQHLNVIDERRESDL